ncbi:MAG: hypothetical protein EKK42_20360 [Pseudonocardiaceae bacterium]|nr:MAG: hypothetical protein EKK42_20360 [Pseudonocardiaceae bacterium]
MSADFRSASSDQRTVGTNTAPAKPAGVVSGDLLIALAFSDRSGTLAAMTAPSGWSLLDSNTTTNAGFVKIWYKIAGGSEPTSYTFADSASSDSTAIIVAVQKDTFDAADPFYSGPTWASSSTAATAHVAPSVSGVTDGLLITGYFGGSGSNGTRTYTTPSGMTERAECSANLWVVSAADTQALTSNAATGTKSATCSASVAWIAVSLVVKPAATQQDIAAAASTAGAGALSAAATRVHSAAESNAGAGALTAAATRVQLAEAAATASGVLSASLAVVKGVGASGAGSGALSASATQQHRPSLALGGAGSLVASISQDRAASVDLTAEGSLGADGRGTQPAASSSGATGALGAAAVRVQFAQVTMSGTAHGSFSLSTTGNADLPAQGVLSASANLTQLAAVGAAGAGALYADASQQMTVTGDLTAVGALDVSATRVHPVSASMSATGAASADGRRVHPLSAALSGVSSSLTASATRVHAARVNMSAAGVFGARPSTQVGGPLNVSLYAVVSGDLVPLADFETLTISPILNEPGAIEIKYPEAGQGFNLLRSNITNDRDLEVEVWISGQRSSASRWIISDSSGDDVDEQAVWSFTGVSLNNLMSEIVVFPQAGAEKLELIISAASAGKVIRTIVSQAQSRGSLAGLKLGFSDSVDSNGIPWANNITTKFSPGTTGKSVMDTLVNLGLCEWEITKDRVLKAYNPNGLGIDRTVGDEPVILRRGQSVSEAPRKHSVRDSYTAMLAAGSEGIYSNTSDAQALARRGRRIEGFASANNLQDTSAVSGYAQTALSASSAGVMELTQALEFTPGDPRPGTSYLEGDWVFAETRNTLERLRIKQWSLTVGPDGPSGTISLGDLISERTAQLARRLESVTNGSATVGTSEPTEDTGIPAVPTGVVVGSDPYVGPNGEALASVTVGWDEVTTNVDGSTATDISGYNVEFMYNSGITQSGWTFGGTSSNTQLTFADIVQGENIDVRVQTVDRNNNVSEWSAVVSHSVAVDNTPPPIPSTPNMDNFLGVLRITWDGLSSVGAEMPRNFDHVEVHLSTSAVFTPDDTTRIGELYAKGTVVYVDGVYGTGYFSRLVAINTAGLPSSASGTATATPEKVVGDDVFDGAIGTAKLADAAITTAKINDLAVNDAKVGSLSVGKLTTGTFVASMTLSGTIQTAATGQRMVIDNSGWKAYNSSGTIFAQLNIAASTILVTGTYQSGLTGERINILPDGTMRIYGASGTDYAQMANAGGIVRFRSRADTNSRRSFVDLNPSGMSVYYGIEGGATYSGLECGRTFGVIRAPVLGARVLSQYAAEDGTGNRFFFTVSTNGAPSGDQGPSVLHYYNKTGNQGAVLNAPGQNSGLWFASDTLSVVGSGDTYNMPITASEYRVGSSGLTKTPAEAPSFADDGSLSAVDVIDRAPSLQWRYLRDGGRPKSPGFSLTREDEDGNEFTEEQEWETPAPPQRRHFGPIAEDLQAIDDDLVIIGPDGRVYVDLRDLVGVNWAATGELLERVRLLESAIRGDDPFIVDGDVL